LWAATEAEEALGPTAPAQDTPGSTILRWEVRKTWGFLKLVTRYVKERDRSIYRSQDEVSESRDSL
jgi:hypothetical protein